MAQPVCAAPARHEEPRRASTEALNLARDGTSRLRDRRSSYVSGGTLVWASATTPLAFVTSRAAAEGPFSFSSRRCDTTLAPARGGRTHLDARHPGTSRGSLRVPVTADRRIMGPCLSPSRRWSLRLGQASQGESRFVPFLVVVRRPGRGSAWFGAMSRRCADRVRTVADLVDEESVPWVAR